MNEWKSVWAVSTIKIRDPTQPQYEWVDGWGGRRRRRNRRRSYFVGLFLVVIVTDGSRESYSDHHHVQFRFTVIA